MSDLFHPEVSGFTISRVHDVMYEANWHQFQLLTKRSKRMRDVFTAMHAESKFSPAVDPLPNLWVGVSVESDRYKFRIDHLRDTPAAVRWLSIEPLVGPLSMTAADLDGIDWVVVGGESGPGSRPMHPDWARSVRNACTVAGVPFFFKQWGNWAPTAYKDGAAMVTRDGSVGYSIPAGTNAVMFQWMQRYNRKSDAGRLLDGRVWDEYPNTEETPVRGDS